MSDVRTTLQQLLARYQRRLIARRVVILGLGLGALAVAVWRCARYGFALGWCLAIGLVGLVGLGLWQWAELRRRRLPPASAALALDQALGLESRLLTAAEFADVPTPPALYPALLEETAQALGSAARLLPRVADRRTCALAGLLLLLLLWPGPHSPLSGLMNRSDVDVPPSELPPPPDLPPPEASHDQQPQSSSSQGSQQQSAGGGDQASPSQQGSSESSSDQGNQGPSGEAGSSSSQGTSQASSSSQAGPSQPSPQSGTDQASPQSAQGQSSSTQGDQPTPQKGNKNTQQAQDSATSKQQPSAAQEATQATQGKGTGSAKPEAAAATGGAGNQQGHADSGKLDQRSGAAGSGVSASQQLLKEDIQQLLKELSTELKQLQADLTTSQQQDQPTPLAGTTTDPELYDETSALDPGGGPPLPLPLDVDEAPASSTRKGSGVGSPSGKVASTKPQQAAEEAALSDQPTEEQGVTRQAIPPEYQPVFERLSQQPPTTLKDDDP